MNVAEIRSAIVTNNFTNDELNEITQAINFARAQLRNQAKRTLRVGTEVAWSGRNGAMRGKLQKIARKFAIVQTNIGNWRVPLNMLETV